MDLNLSWDNRMALRERGRREEGAWFPISAIHRVLCLILMTIPVEGTTPSFLPEMLKLRDH